MVKQKKIIAKEIKEYIQNYRYDNIWEEGERYDSSFGNGEHNTYFYIKDGVKSEEYVGTSKSEKVEFYGYYSDYDWVAFCQLYGIMMNLPNGYPYYCIDLKQKMDDIVKELPSEYFFNLGNQIITEGESKPDINIFGHHSLNNKLKILKYHSGYPKSLNAHNALSDARWNKKLDFFLFLIQSEV